MLYTSQKSLKSKTCINQRKDFSSKSNSILIKVIFDLNWLLALLRMPRISLKLYSSLLWWCWMRKLLFSKHHEQKSFRQSNVVPGITYHQNVTFHFEKCLFWIILLFQGPPSPHINFFRNVKIVLQLKFYLLMKRISQRME